MLSSLGLLAIGWVRGELASMSPAVDILHISLQRFHLIFQVPVSRVLLLLGSPCPSVLAILCSTVSRISFPILPRNSFGRISPELSVGCGHSKLRAFEDAQCLVDVVLLCIGFSFFLLAASFCSQGLITCKETRYSRQDIASYLCGFHGLYETCQRWEGPANRRNRLRIFESIRQCQGVIPLCG